jgi:hypothetical protein
MVRQTIEDVLALRDKEQNHQSQKNNENGKAAGLQDLPKVLEPRPDTHEEVQVVGCFGHGHLPRRLWGSRDLSVTRSR